MKDFSVTRNGKALDTALYIWDEKTKVFSTSEDNLVLDFQNWNGVTFITGHYCTFKTDWGCTFKTGRDCTFDTDSHCTFNTGSNCTFTCKEECVIVRRDVFEILQPPPGIKIILNGKGVKGISNKGEVMEALL